MYVHIMCICIYVCMYEHVSEYVYNVYACA